METPTTKLTNNIMKLDGSLAKLAKLGKVGKMVIKKSLLTKSKLHNSYTLIICFKS